jgi:hypothetical protein
MPWSNMPIEHTIPRKHSGNGDPANLALACDRCHSCEGATLTGIDPETGEIVLSGLGTFNRLSCRPEPGNGNTQPARCCPGRLRCR